MGNKFYISDWHYGHANILSFDNRPWVSIEAMNEALIENWNSVVGKGDMVYMLGDMFWYKDDAGAVLDRLNGQKVLIKGNHDWWVSGDVKKKLVSVADYAEIDDEGRTVVLCHYPIPCFNKHYYGAYHLYGHVHSGFEWNMMEHNKLRMRELYTVPCWMFNVGAMIPYMGYTPRTLTEIIEGANV
jgi:calcineurin-like phosphoesterase family protein